MSDNASEMVTLTIDNTEVSVPKGTLIIRAAEQIGIRIPRFCDHPLLKPVGACRQCLVEVAMPDREGNVRPMPKPQTACSMTVMPGMEVKTQRTSEVAEKAQKGIMEFLLINHPLDCPVCDKGGECPLQNQAMTEGREVSRFADVKRTFPKPVRLSTQILLDRERCILCQRCVRFSKEIAGDAFIDLQGRGGGTAPTEDHYFMGEQIGTFDTQVLGFHDEHAPDHALPAAPGLAGPCGNAGVAGSLHPGVMGPSELDETGRPFASYFSGNTIQICPVGALTASSYRFRGRPFDLASTPSITEHDASGSAIRVDIRRGHIVRRLAGNDPEVNEEWITDKDRFAFGWCSGEDRLETPLVREDGQLRPATWAEALARAAEGLRAAQEAGTQVAFLPGGRLSVEDAYAWSKFARTVMGTNQIDQRVRSASDEETAFLGARVAGRGLDVTYGDVEKAGRVLLVGLETEEEIGALFLRLRKGVSAGSVKVTTVAPFTTAGSEKLSADVLRAAPGTEPEVLDALDDKLVEELAEGVILVGERCAAIPGLYSAVERLIKRSGARVAWVPRRAGERGGVDAGLLPELLPFGRSVADAQARADLGVVWEATIPDQPGKCTEELIEHGATTPLGALVLGGVDLRDFPDPKHARAAIDNAGFVLSLEVVASDVSKHADVVLPVAPPSEKNGTFINWEGRLRPFGQALTSRALTDREVLGRLAMEMGRELGLDTLADTHAEMNELMGWDGPRLEAPACAAHSLTAPGEGRAVLATHKLMLDDGLLQAGAPELAGTARQPVARLSEETLGRLGAQAGQMLRVSTRRGTITLPVVASDLPEDVVWLPECSPGSHVHDTLGAGHGSIVSIAAQTEVTR